MDLYADNVVLMPPNEPSLYGKAEVREWHEEYFEHFRIITLAETERDVILMAHG
jgi:ketosteroid isomerase-like protein